MNRAGEPLPESSIEKRKASLKKSKGKTVASASFLAAGHSPEARAKAAKTRVENHFAKLREQGIYRCPECWDKQHRAIDFSSGSKLGKHRRFKHGVMGRSHDAKKMQELASQTKVVNGTLMFQCPHCERSFPKQHGLSVHISSAHQISTEMALTPPTISKELTNGDGRTQAVTQQPEAKADRNGHRHSDAALAQALAIAHVTGIIENVILTVAAKYDLPPRQFASRVVVSLGERYQEER